jgi:hypothetical protein
MVEGQATYSSLATASSNIFTEPVSLSPLLESGVLVTVLIVQEGTADLSNTATAEFIDVFNQSSGGTGGGIGDMLKSVYDPTNVNGSAFLFANMTDLLLNANITDATITKQKLAQALQDQIDNASFSYDDRLIFLEIIFKIK